MGEPAEGAPRPAAIAVLAKTPVVGRVKTRMIGALSPAGAAAVHAATLDDVLERHARAWLTHTLWWDGDAAPRVEPGSAGAWTLLRQPGGGLDVRIAAAIDTGLCSVRRVVVIGSDSPDMPDALFAAAVEALDRADLSFVAAEDGGFTLVGSRVPIGAVLSGVQWSAETTLQETRARLDDAGLRSEVVGRWYDLDTVADLHRLWIHSAAPDAGAHRLAPRTLERARELLSARDRDCDGDDP